MSSSGLDMDAYAQYMAASMFPPLIMHNNAVPAAVADERIISGGDATGEFFFLLTLFLVFLFNLNRFLFCFANLGKKRGKKKKKRLGLIAAQTRASIVN